MSITVLLARRYIGWRWRLMASKTHSEKIDLLLGQYPLLRQICDWNIEIAADERGEQ